MIAGAEVSTRTTRTDGNSAEDGWTLLELLVALALMSLMMVLLTRSLDGARASLKTLNQPIGATAVEAARSYLRLAIAQAHPIRPPGAAPEETLLDGGPNTLRFVTSYGPAGQYGGLYVLQLELAPGSRSGTWDVMEKRTLYRPSSQVGGPEPARPVVASRLVESIASISFRYLGKHAERPAVDWESAWSDPVLLPDLVEIDLSFPEGDRRRWSPIVIALPVGH